MNKLDQLFSNARAMKESRDATAKKNVSETLATIFAELPKLGMIRVQGYTPGFNDGDPCTHSQLVSVDNYDPDYLLDQFFDGDEEEQKEAMEEDEAFKLLSSSEKLDWNHHTYSAGRSTENPLPEDAHAAGCIKAQQVLGSIEADFQILFDTNFTLTITRDASSEFGFKIDRQDYDCGY